MRELEMDVWDAPADAWIGIPTNGTVRANHRLVMGRGVAQQAKEKFADLDWLLGLHVYHVGNTPMVCHGTYYGRNWTFRLFSFPVKHNWWESADIALIARSTVWLDALALESPKVTFYLPRPGCGNGRLLWSDVKPVIEFLPDNVIVVHKNLPTLVEVSSLNAKG